MLLDSDRRDQLPPVIQEHVFDNIKISDFVYVWNPDGYLGNSTCYEIGKIMEMKKRIFFKEKPKDLPVKIEKNMIKEPEEIIGLLHNKKQ